MLKTGSKLSFVQLVLRLTIKRFDLILKEIFSKAVGKIF
jgi:hypothetical protein